MARIAINGFGRIGRSFFRMAFGMPEFDIVAVNDLADPATLAYLLKYDSVYGKYQKKVEAMDSFLEVEGKNVEVLAEKDPANLPWKDLGIDIVIESTGFFTSAEKAKAHLGAGAKKVIITAPAKGDVDTLLVGVNDDQFKTAGTITCNASCTTNSVAPVMAVLLETLGVEKASMITVHGYTATQKLVDGPDAKDLRRGRAAAVNIVPSTTGAAEAVIQALPGLKDKFDAVAIRVPTISGSLSAMTVLTQKNATKEEVNEIFKKASESARWSKVIKYSEDPLVSTDIVGEPYGAIVDSQLTKVVDGNLVKIFSWYDNEAGYTATLIEHVKRVIENL